jgi:quercetin dioxygenase-like cupin family protein
VTEWWGAIDGIFIKQMPLPKRDDVVIQHRHVWDHATMVAKGAVYVVREGGPSEAHEAPAMIHIIAGISHSFIALKDDTLLYCIHNLHGEQAVKVLAEHGLAEGAT